ncbi:hypothetical protein AALA54_15730, partial [Oscillospiraceae bacterium 44-34]
MKPNTKSRQYVPRRLCGGFILFEKFIIVILSQFQRVKNVGFNGSGTDQQVIETRPFLSNPVNTFLGLRPQFPTFRQAEINDFVGLLEISAPCPGLILNKSHGIGLVIVGGQVFGFPVLNRNRPVHPLDNPPHPLHFFREVIEHNQAIIRTVH